MVRRGAFAFVPLLLAVACSSSPDDPGAPATVKPQKYTPTALPPLASAVTTVDATFAPSGPRQAYSAGPNPAAAPADLKSYLDRGFGELAPAAGQPLTTRVMGSAAQGTPPAPPGPNAKRLLRFVHLADLQLSDDESPTRVGQLDAAGFTSAALRPQDAYICRMTNAAVRTINALHRKDPVAFTLMGGDNADSAQSNEVDWVLGILSGSASVECDSGDDDDPVPGPDNDGKDPFVAEGFAMPWKWVTGNHDVLVQGNVAVNEFNKSIALGDTASNGTRDYRPPFLGGITSDLVVADPKRVLLDRASLMTKVAADKDGHGLGAAEKASGRATYTFDAEGTPFRFLVLDTAHEKGGAEGVIKKADVDATIKPLLDKAKADGKWVILASHHAQSSLTAEGGALGVTEPDAMLPDAWATFIGGYSNVVFSMVGHSHENRVRAVTPAAVTGHAWWEVMTAAIADFPHQFRVVEIYDQDNGWMMMRASTVDFSVDGDPVAMEGRRRGVVDFTTGWNPSDGTGQSADRNVELWIEKPQ
jgi:3',5'-cyclic AMP phosphodiesterase CpdA